MINTLYACLINRKIPDKKVAEELKAVYIDELTKEKSPPQRRKAAKKSVRFADSEPKIVGEEEDNEKGLVKGSCGGKELGERGRGIIRVNVKMTKEEAARLLSKCKEGGVLEFKDVARELVALPVNRVSVVSISTNHR